MSLPASIIAHSSESPLTGTLTVPGDKSITHRAVFFGVLNQARTIVVNPSPALDVRTTVDLVRALGHEFRPFSDRWQFQGYRRHGYERVQTLDCGNSGTTARLAAGLLCCDRGTFTLTGDPSLVRRPMQRVVDPLRMLGADLEGTVAGTMPLIVRGAGPVRGNIEQAVEVGSAQVHAAVVLAALRSGLGAVLRRTVPMRDHTLRMLKAFSAGVETRGAADMITASFLQRDVLLRVPGDLSSAAFLVAAAVLVPGSHVTIREVGLNPTRTGFLQALKLMGANLEWTVESDDFEPIGTITAAYSPDLHGIRLPGDIPGGAAMVRLMADELPLLALVATQADGRTGISGAAELRVKESDRITATVTMLQSLGVQMQECEDGFMIEGKSVVRGGVCVEHCGDHRLCMMAAVAALIAQSPVTIPDPTVADVSYPGFWQDIARLQHKQDHT